MPSSTPEATVDSTWLSGGGLRLALHGRPTRSGESTAPVERARIITMVWGESYLEHLINFAIPAVLAPGNLPCVAENFDTELVIVTETRLFDRLAQSAIIARALKYCDVRLHPIDDLIATHYGITLTYALVRGFEDLGEEIVNTHLIFFNSDFIVADGSYRKLVDVIKRGERLVLSPSYCLVSEESFDQLRKYYDTTTSTLSISQRDLAALVIAHRHKTTRAKTMNQRLFRHHRYDQFYWYVDEHTMLARMLPVATVYMRPEKPLTRLDTFWDYGAISEYCPTTEPCVLGDSDDFLMGEFRDELALKDLFTLGFPSDQEIVEDLSTFTTQYHRDHSKYMLVLHSQPLPATIEVEKQRFRTATDAILEKLAPPVDYKNHKFWADSFPRFQAAQKAGQLALQARERAHAAEVKARTLRERTAAHRQADDSPPITVRGAPALTPEQRNRCQKLEAELEALDRQMLHLDGLLGTLTIDGAAAKANKGDSNWPAAQLPPSEGQEFRSDLQELTLFYARIAKLIRALHGFEVELKAARADVEGKRNELWSELTRLKGPFPEQTSTVEAAAAPERDENAGSITIQFGPLPTSLNPRLANRLFRLVCGSRSRLKITHPYFLIFSQITRALRKAAGGRPIDLLVLCSENVKPEILVAGTPTGRMVIAPAALVQELSRHLNANELKFDVCLCCLSFEDLKKFRTIVDKAVLLLRDPGKFLVFYANLSRQDLAAYTHELTKTLFPLIGTSAISFSGSVWSANAMRWCRLATRLASRRGGFIPAGLAAAVSIFLAVTAAWRESRRLAHVYPLHCTSMTMEIDLPPMDGRGLRSAEEVAHGRAAVTAAAGFSSSSCAQRAKGGPRPLPHLPQ
jgi:hypothetical protein